MRSIKVGLLILGSKSLLLTFLRGTLEEKTTLSGIFKFSFSAQRMKTERELAVLFSALPLAQTLSASQLG